jgi:multiple sugar transport system permease protein
MNAARILGANRWQIFWRIQLPLLKPAIMIAVVIRTMEALKLFDQAVLLTFGGPGTVFNKYSFGAAASVLLLIFFAGLIYFGIYMLVRERATLEQEGA